MYTVYPILLLGLNCAPDNVTQCLQDFIAKNKADVLEIYKHLERLLEVDSLCALLKVR